MNGWKCEGEQGKAGEPRDAQNRGHGINPSPWLSNLLIFVSFSASQDPRSDFGISKAAPSCDTPQVEDQGQLCLFHTFSFYPVPPKQLGKCARLICASGIAKRSLLKWPSSHTLIGNKFRSIRCNKSFLFNNPGERSFKRTYKAQTFTQPKLTEAKG